MYVFAAHLEAGAAIARALARAATAPHVRKQVGKEVLGAVAGAGEVVLRGPVRGRLESFSGLVAATAQVVVGGTLFDVTEHVVGFVDFLGFLGRVRVLADVRVVLAHELAVGFLDVFRGRAVFQPQSLVIVLVLHAHLRKGFCHRNQVRPQTAHSCGAEPCSSAHESSDVIEPSDPG